MLGDHEAAERGNGRERAEEHGSSRRASDSCQAIASPRCLKCQVQAAVDPDPDDQRQHQHIREVVGDVEQGARRCGQ